MGLLLSDDWLEREAVAECLKETADIVSSGNTVHFADGQVNEAASKDASTARFLTCATLHDKANYLEHFFLFRREFLLSAGGLDESIGNFPGIDDFDLIWTLLERGATVAIIEKRLYHYRDHESERLTLNEPDLAVQNLRKILEKHGVRGHDAEQIIVDHARWYAQPIYRVLNGAEAASIAQAAPASALEAICSYAARIGLKQFVLHGSRPTEYVAQETCANSSYRETGRPISVATSPKGRLRIKAPFAFFGNVICTQQEFASGVFWCLDLLKSGYAFLHFPTLFGPQRISLIEQLARNCLARAGCAIRARTSFHAAVQELAKHRSPSYPPNAKRILMITSTFNRGGSERQMINTAAALVAHGYDVRILALGLTAPGTPTMEHEIVRLGIKPEFHTDFLSTERPFQPCFEAEPLLKIYQLPTWFSARAGPVGTAIRHHQPGVVHCWLEMPGIIAALAACALGVPRVVLAQRNALGHMQTSGYTEDIKAFLASGYPALARNPNAVILNNSAIEARKYERRFGLSQNTIRVLYNGFAPSILRKPTVHEVLEFRSRFGLDPHTPIIGTLMRFVRQKDPELWLEVAAEVAAARPDAHFLLAGYGEMENIIATRIQALGLGDRVILPGVIEDVALFYAAVDVVLLTSVAEGTPNVLIEAQAAGRPVVAPNVGGIAETIANGLSGRLVDNRSARRFAKAIVTILDDDEWRINAGIQGPSFIADRFDAERMARETLKYTAWGIGPSLGTNKPRHRRVGSPADGRNEILSKT